MRPFSSAAAHRYRKGDNPARWKGQLEVLLPAPAKVARVKHHPALPYKELPDFFRLLRNQEGVGALALEFTILTAAAGRRRTELASAQPL